MSKIVFKMIAIVLVVLFVSSFTLNVYAGFNFSQEIKKQDSGSDKSGASNAATNITGALLNVFRIAAVGIALIMLVVVAIKYMSAAPEGKAEIKKHAVIYIVGAIVLFASAGILSIIESFANQNINNAV